MRNKKEIVCLSHLRGIFRSSIIAKHALFFAHTYHAKHAFSPGAYHLSHSQQFPHPLRRPQPTAVQVQPNIYSYHLSNSSLLLRRTTRHPLKLPRVLPRHARLVPRAFAAFPEAVAFLADEPGVAEAAVFGAVVLLAGACEVGIFVSCLVFFGVYSRGHGSFGCALSYCLGWGWVWNGAYRSRCERKLALNATEDYV